MAQSNFADDIQLAIKGAVELQIKKIAEEELAKAQQNIDTRLKAALGSIALSVLQSYDIMNDGRRLIITVNNRT